MSNWPLPPAFSSIEQGGANAADSSAVTVTAGLRALGSWTEIIAATGFEYGMFFVNIYATSRGYMEIGIGAAASEVAIATIPTAVGGYQNYRETMPIYIPVPAGERISVRASGSTTATVEAQIVGIARTGLSQFPLASVASMEGIETAGSSVTHGQKIPVDPGGTANTKGSWTEIVASMADDYSMLHLLFDDNQVSAQTGQDRLWDFAIGAGGSEVAFLSDIYQTVTGSEMVTPSNLLIPWGLSAGTRLAARMQCSITGATDRMGGCAIVGYK